MQIFLQNLFNKKKLPNNKIICFTSDYYSLLFFSHLFKQFKRLLNQQVVYFDKNNQFNSIKSSLMMSFLGQTQIYWLGNISECSFKEKEQILSFIITYNGPHIIFLFLNEEDRFESENSQIINCNFKNNEYKEIVTYLWPDNNKKIIYFIEQLLNHQQNVTLDQICLLANYATVIGSNYNHFFEFWLNKIRLPEKSLFDLSKHFFALNEFEFFSLLDELNEFSPQFWIAFWSEQLFRASNFIKLRKHKALSEAKSISYRLPFSFIQYDWKKFSSNQLSNAHDFLYTADYYLKNGNSKEILDVFYLKHFLGQFS